MAYRTFQAIVDDLVKGIQDAYKEAPKELTTFEEIGKWAGQHVIIHEREEVKDDDKN
jgi:hypothetical protein